MDGMAKREYRNRSELIREALRAYLRKQESWDQIYAYGRRVAKKMNIKSEEDVNRIHTSPLNNLVKDCSTSLLK